MTSSVIGGADEKETGRVEAFSDGVLAIAITLLALEVRVPRELHEGSSLLTALIEQWPSYLAFVASFLTILIMWANHHRMFTMIRRVDAPLMLFNGLLLMGISLVPFTSALVAEYVNHTDSANQRVAAAVYGGWFLLIAIFFNLVWRRAARGRRLIGRDVAQQQVDAINEQYRFGPLFYLGATVLSLLSVPVGLFAYIAIAVYFMLPGNVRATSAD